MAKEEGKKLNLLAIFSGAVGLAGAIAWSKKDLAKGVMGLQKKKVDWVQINQEPAVYLTKADQLSRQALFDHLGESDWRLVDQIADGFFWLNSQDQILLLSQTSVLMGKYDTWVASRKFMDCE